MTMAFMVEGMLDEDMFRLKLRLVNGVAFLYDASCLAIICVGQPYDLFDSKNDGAAF